MSPCTKRRFDSSTNAKRAQARAGWRIRTYRCPDCGGFHVANGDKRRALAAEIRPASRRSSRPRDLAPERTLAQVEAMAAERRARG